MCLVPGSFKSVAEIIRYDLTETQKLQLYNHILEAFKDVRPEDLIAFIPLLLTPGHYQNLALEQMILFFTNQMQMQIID
jgi:predicted Zn-dependent peptidase